LIEFFDKEESVLNRLKFTLSLSTTGVKFWASIVQFTALSGSIEEVSTKLSTKNPDLNLFSPLLSSTFKDSVDSSNSDNEV
jgi:NAD/NADP transhydrogenase beta subunit